MLIFLILFNYSLISSLKCNHTVPDLGMCHMCHGTGPLPRMGGSHHFLNIFSREKSQRNFRVGPPPLKICNVNKSLKKKNNNGAKKGPQNLPGGKFLYFDSRSQRKEKFLADRGPPPIHGTGASTRVISALNISV